MRRFGQNRTLPPPSLFMEKQNFEQKDSSVFAIAVVTGVFLIFGVLIYIITRTGPFSPSASTDNAVSPPQISGAGETASKEVSNFKHAVIIETTKGVIKLLTYDADAPKTVDNFLKLAGKNFYNGLIFHRVAKGFVIQGGDPNCAPDFKNDKGQCGAGGPGYKFDDELKPDTESARDGYKKGVAAMANSGPNTNGSQFFIMLADTPLPHQYTIFGKVVEGQDVVDSIGSVDVSSASRPVEPVVIKKISASAAK